MMSLSQLFAVNRRLDEDVTLDCDARSFGKFARIERSVLHHDDLKVLNTGESPDNVSPVRLPDHPDKGAEIVLRSASWNMIRLVK